MNVRDAIHDAVEATLRQTLAPELVTKLADDILARAQRGIEEGLANFAGFEIGRPAGRGRPATRANKASESTRRRAAPAPAADAGDDGSGDVPAWSGQAEAAGAAGSM